MKKIRALFLILPVACSSCTVTPTKQMKQPTIQSQIKQSPFLKISTQDQLVLKQLNAKKENFSYEKKQLLLGNKNTTARKKQLFLLHNKSRDPLILDFPQGHVGGTAGIMQMIQPGEWYAYFYVQGKDYRAAESPNKKIRYTRPTWTCQKGSPNYKKYNSCKKYLDIYSIDYNLENLKITKRSLDYKLLQILTYNNRTKWLTHISSPSITQLLKQIHTKHFKKNT